MAAASALTFDDTEKQAKYNTISFDEIRDAIRELKVIFSDYVLFIDSR